MACCFFFYDNEIREFNMELVTQLLKINEETVLNIHV